MTVESTLEKLEGLLLEVRGRLEKLEGLMGPEPTCLRMPEAAKRLGVGLTTLKEMVRRGEIRTAKVGRVPMVTLAEIRRVSTPEAERPREEARVRASSWQPIPKRRARR